MSDLGFNKIAFCVLGTGLAMIGINEASHALFHETKHEVAAYKVDVPTETVAEAETETGPVDYGVLLPPDYFLPEAENTRYPVLYFFHGQGMEAADLVALGLALLGPMKESARTDRLSENKTDLQRAIIIWADGNCNDDTCYTGNFYTDFKGQPRDDRRFESAFYELVKHVESTYRTKTPELIPLSQIDNQ